MKWLDAARTRLRLLFLRRDAESRMNREFQLHIEMEAEHLMRAKGLTADEASMGQVIDMIDTATRAASNLIYAYLQTNNL